MLILSRREVEAVLEPGALLDAVSAGLQALSAGAVNAPPRSSVQLPAGAMLTMPGRREGGPVVVKLVGVVPGNVAIGLEAHQAVICLFDATTGRCLALMDGEHITALRTAAAAALAARACARADARVLSVVGSGVQARVHLMLLPLVRRFTEIRVVARDQAAAAALAASVGGGVVAPSAGDADVICLATSAGAPVLRAEEVVPGTHVSSVGYAPPGGELDPALARAGRLFVESRDAFSPPPAGCAELAGLDPALGTELGDVLSGRAAGREDPAQITVYKAMGHVAEDAAAAELAYTAALAAGIGRTVEL
jgi:ornithine cyclodeaminase/alanine dehydrogenase-like protein (mu-crystallin family)